MTSPSGAQRPARTVLEQRIRERRQTFEEFAEYAERFARDHHEPGTLSVRHLERLAAGRRGDGRPLGPVRPATARLLEHIFGASVSELLAAPAVSPEPDAVGLELRQRIGAARRVDPATLDLLADQLDNIRRLDRQLGAIVTYREMTAKVTQLTGLLAHSLTPAIRTRLAELLAQTTALAGWAALDLGKLDTSWRHHEHAKAAAREANSTALLAHAQAQQAVILLDLAETSAAVTQLAEARALATDSAPPVLRAWLAAAHGEGLAAAGSGTESLHAFDTAHNLWPTEVRDPALPFVFLGGPHLARWRGHALALLGHPAAIAVLTEAFRDLDQTFTRATLATRLDLATAHAKLHQMDDAKAHLRAAQGIADDIGSARQQARVRTLSRQSESQPHA